MRKNLLCPSNPRNSPHIARSYLDLRGGRRWFLGGVALRRPIRASRRASSSAKAPTHAARRRGGPRAKLEKSNNVGRAGLGGACWRGGAGRAVSAEPGACLCSSPPPPCYPTSRGAADSSDASGHESQMLTRIHVSHDTLSQVTLTWNEIGRFFTEARRRRLDASPSVGPDQARPGRPVAAPRHKRCYLSGPH